MRTQLRIALAVVGSALAAAPILGLMASAADAASSSSGHVYPTVVPGPPVKSSPSTNGFNFIGLDGVDSWPLNNRADVNCITYRNGTRAVAVRPPGFLEPAYWRVDVHTRLWKWNNTTGAWTYQRKIVQHTASWSNHIELRESAFQNLTAGYYAVNFKLVWLAPVARDGVHITSWTPAGTKVFDAGGYERSWPMTAERASVLDEIFAPILFSSQGLSTPYCKV